MIIMIILGLPGLRRGCRADLCRGTLEKPRLGSLQTDSIFVKGGAVKTGCSDLYAVIY